MKFSSILVIACVASFVPTAFGARKKSQFGSQNRKRFHRNLENGTIAVDSGNEDCDTEEDPKSCGGSGKMCCPLEKSQGGGGGGNGKEQSSSGSGGGSGKSSSSSGSGSKGGSKGGSSLCNPGLGCDVNLEKPKCTIDCGSENQPCCQSICSNGECTCECGSGLVFDYKSKTCVKCGGLGQPCCCDSSNVEAYLKTQSDPIPAAALSDLASLSECFNGCPGEENAFCGSGGKCLCSLPPSTCIGEYTYHFERNDGISFDAALASTPPGCKLSPVHDEAELAAIYQKTGSNNAWVGIQKNGDLGPENPNTPEGRRINANGWTNLDGTPLASNDGAITIAVCTYAPNFVGVGCWGSIEQVQKYWSGTNNDDEPNNGPPEQRRAHIKQGGKLRDVVIDYTASPTINGAAYKCCTGGFTESCADLASD